MLLTSWLQSIRSTHVRRNNRKTRAAAQVEVLEDRTLLSVGSVFIQATGTLMVSTDTSDDVAITADTGGNVLVNGVNPQTGPLSATAVLGISVTGGQGANDIDLSGVATADFTALTAGAIEVHGGDGTDTMTASPLGGFYVGDHGDDVLTGGLGDDTINGDDGNDTIDGNAGADNLIGEDGNDVIDGGAGDDVISAGDGADQDLLIGHDGQDDLDGQGGSPDTLVGSDAFDILNDNAGSDLVDNTFEFLADWIDAA